MPHLSGYTLTELLQAGSFAILHRGYRNVDRAPVVVKLPNSEYAGPREVARIRHDYLIGRALDSPCVVKPYALERATNGLALILEDFGGRPLVDILRSEWLELATALRIAASLAEAVGAIHQLHIIHKDIKPHNIFVNTATFAVKLTDFGIATRLSEEAYKRAPPDALAGTLSYMSPEQTGRMNRALDYRTDLYSLGVTLYEMLTGSLPFVATDPMELVHSHIARTPPSPHERAPEVPEVVSRIVMKLLAKTAEDRYQSAHGLKADLDTCLLQWDESKRIEPFPLGQRDQPAGLRIVQKLYGREAETAALLAAFERVSAGGAELLLVSGYAGVGKSALVGEIHQAIGRRGGYFSAGKFDQLSRDVPYTAVATALRELLRHLLAAPEESLARWKLDLSNALGKNGQLLVNLIPELALLIGREAPVPELGPTESQNRFNLVFQRFLGVFTASPHPLVLFLDDLQWADPASLKLLSLLLTPEQGHLLVIGAYRDHEVKSGHPLSLALAELRDKGARVSEIALPPLDLSDVTKLIADTLDRDETEVLPLARIAFDKTYGNPFFLGQLLRSLHAEGWITFDRSAGAWGWDLERIRAADVTDNVVDFMAGKIARLSPETQRVLQLAACIGHEFDLKALSVISELSPQATAAALWEALREGLVLPLSADYRFLSEKDSEATATLSPALPFGVAYRFLHDRVQQAAYSLIDERHKQEVHLRIGRLLRDQSDEREREERLFATVDHLNLGAKLIVERSERIELARANLAAGKRAKAATAYAAARRYIEAAAALVDEACWEEAYPLSFSLHVERAECAYLNGHVEQAESLLHGLLAHAASTADRAQVYKLLIVFCTARSDFAGAIRFGRAGLALFGIDLPETEEEQNARVNEEFTAIKVNLGGSPIAELASAPLIAPEHRMPLDLLVQMSPASFFSGPPLYGLISSMQTNLCLKHGRSDLAAFSYAYTSMIQVSPLGQYKDGCEFFKVSCALDEQFDNILLRGKTHVILVSIAHFFISFRAVLPYVARAQRASLETGDFLFLSFTCYHDVMPRLCAGDELGQVSDVLQKAFALAHRTGSALVIATLVIARQFIAALLGRTTSPTSLSDEAHDEARHLLEMEEAKSFDFAISWYYTVKLELLCLHGDHQGALEAARGARARAGAAATFHFYTDVPFYEGISLAALCLSGSGLSESAADKERYASLLAEDHAQMAIWAESCPENYRYKKLLLGALLARIEGDHDSAEALYDDAIEAARRDDVSHHEALANELAADYYQSQGKKKIARLYLTEAYHAYLRWGANAKASDLAKRYSKFISAQVSPAVGLARRAADTTILADRAEALDAATLVRAAQALTSEIILENLLDRLMRIVVENAGADRGVLLLYRDEQLVIEATLTVASDVVEVGSVAPLSADADLAVSVIHFVERTMEPVVIADATLPGPFSDDPYLVARPPKSLLCLSMTQKNKVAGILYLENHAVSDAFTPARVELSRLLVSHAAIAVENALLVAELKRRTEALSQANDALGEANAALRAANEQLGRELYEREQAELARAALKSELGRVQTPFIPITDAIAVMPLIGSIDAERARQILEAALRGVEASRARIVILDVTGVREVDASVTGSLLSTARVLRLLGAQAVITGIHPEMARALVELSLNLGDIVSKGTLQSGITYAMSRLGGADQRKPRS